MTQRSRKIRNLLISPRFQFRFIFWAVRSCFCLIFYFSAVLYSTIRQYHLTAVSELPASYALGLEAQYNAMVFRLTLGSLAIVVFSIIFGVLISHKTAGPLHQLRLAFDRVIAGNLDARVHFRSNDEFQEIGESFNSMMEKVEAELGSSSAK
jgi:methyl-accepting chemotaxis protein